MVPLLLVCLWLWLTFDCMSKVASAAESEDIDKSKIVLLGDGIDDFGEIPLRVILGRLSDKWEVNIESGGWIDAPGSVEVQVTTKKGESPVRLSFLPSAYSRDAYILESVSFKFKKWPKFADQLAVLGQLGVIRLDALPPQSKLCSEFKEKGNPKVCIEEEAGRTCECYLDRWITRQYLNASRNAAQAKAQELWAIAVEARVVAREAERACDDARKAIDAARKLIWSREIRNGRRQKGLMRPGRRLVVRLAKLIAPL